MSDENIEKIILYHLIFANEELKLSEEDFAFEKNKQIYRAIKELKKREEEVNVISIKNIINPDSTEILTYISNLVEHKYGTSLEFAYKTLKTMTKKRKLILLANALEREVPNELEIDSYIENQIKKLNEMNADTTKQETLQDILLETMEIIEKKMKKTYEENYFTGIFDLDDVTNGLHREELTVIGARPGMGKTSFALNIAEKNANKNFLVGFVSLEMSKTQIIQKLISKVARVDSNKLRTGKLEEAESIKVIEASNKISNLKLDITTEAKSIQDIEIYAKRKKNKENLGLLIIDYLQLITNKEKTQTREQEIASITRSLKLLSLELNIPIIALSQLSRNSSNSKPTLTDLRESGAIEQDADNVIFLYKENEEENKVVEDITLDLQKQRAGGLVTTKVRFDKKYSTFVNLEMKR